MRGKRLISVDEKSPGWELGQLYDISRCAAARFVSLVLDAYFTHETMLCCSPRVMHSLQSVCPAGDLALMHAARLRDNFLRLLSRSRRGGLCVRRLIVQVEVGGRSLAGSGDGWRDVRSRCRPG